LTCFGVPCQLSRVASTEALSALAAAAPAGAVDVSTREAERAAAQGQEAVSSLYAALASRGLLQGFGAVGAGDEPLPNRRVIVAADLPELVGLEQVGGWEGGRWRRQGPFWCAGAGVDLLRARAVVAITLAFLCVLANWRLSPHRRR
jgi:hypothetical protein